ncbi:hypothetical protein H0A71_11320 [Alcaligenaceae bacterium]|nr:hypothetical protein [Alcaligenaceae bacterium]
MDYSDLIKQLGSGLGRQILAFDYSEELGGCLIYLVTPNGCTLLIPDEIIEHKYDDVLSMLRARLKNDNAGVSHEILTDVNDELEFKPAPAKATLGDAAGDEVKPAQCG